MKKIILLLLMLLIIHLLSAEKTGDLAELINPKHLLVNAKKIIVTDYPHIYFYSAKDLQLVKKIGRRGQGPGEFYIDQEWMDRKMMGMVSYLTEEKIYVNSMGRLSVFNLQGDLEKTLTVNPYGGGFYFRPFAAKLLGFRTIRQGSQLFVALNLYDHNLKNEKVLVRKPHWIKDRNVRKINFFKRANGSIQYQTYLDKLYILDTEDAGIHLEVLNGEGERMGNISIATDPVEIPKSFVQDVHSYMRVKFKRGIEHNIRYTEYGKLFPAVRQFRVTDDKIYILTYKRSGSKNELLVLNLKGDLIKKMMLPVAERSPEHLFPFFITDNKFYQLIENEENDTWEQHETKIL